MGDFHLRGIADKKHSFHKIIMEGYKFDPDTGTVIWAVDKKQTGKSSLPRENDAAVHGNRSGHVRL